MNFKKFAIAAITAVSALGMSSCLDSNSEPTGDSIYTDIVTVSDISTNRAVFTLQESNTSPLVTLTSSQTFNPGNLKSGNRVVISYSPSQGAHYKTDNITVIGMAEAFGLGQEIPDTIASLAGNWKSKPVQMGAIWQTGKYLNIAFMANTTSNPTKCELLADSETLNSTYPEVHLIFEPNISSSTSDYIIYMSYSLDDTWSNKACKGVKVFYQEEYSQKSVTIDKINLSPSLPLN